MKEAKLEKASNIDIDEAIEKAQSYLLSLQYPEGYWWGELESNVTITAEYLLLTHLLEAADPARWQKIVNYLKNEQLVDGSWNIYYDGPGDLNATIEAYFALKLAGISKNEPSMQRAKEFILAKGGVPKARIFTKIWLSLFGQYPWEGLPVMPPEIIFLPTWFPFNIYEFSSWARATIVPMLIILTKKPIFPVPKQACLDELYPSPKDRVYSLLKSPKLLCWRNFFLILDRLFRSYERLTLKPGRERAIKRAERWILEHQEADGSWGGIQPPWVYSLIALKCLGYSLNDPVMVKGLAGFEGFAIEDEDAWRLQSCLSPVWDTALAMIALLDSGLPQDHPALVQAARWLLKEQILTGGDWQMKVKRSLPGGWAFEFHNDIYPDTDDTAEVMLALLQIKLPPEEERAKREALQRGLRWLMSMQSRNGGWGSFDKNNTKRFVTQIPFCDFGETIDPPSVDVTAHILELLGWLGYNKDFPPIRRALSYIKREQEADGCWFGRWGVNYIYGTGAVLPGLKAIREYMNQNYIQRAVNWLVEHQNPDGGWGESCASYEDPDLRGQGLLTASQTAWALLALLAAGQINPQVERGIRYLVETQQEDGSWQENYFTGTGFPKDFFIKYHLYGNYFPLMALGRYRETVTSPKSKSLKSFSFDLGLLDFRLFD